MTKRKEFQFRDLTKDELQAARNDMENIIFLAQSVIGAIDDKRPWMGDDGIGYMADKVDAVRRKYGKKQIT